MWLHRASSLFILRSSQKDSTRAKFPIFEQVLGDISLEAPV